MARKTTPARALVRRLLPLYVAVFFQGFVLWYAIEKLFMVDIGFDNATIGLMVAAYSALMLLIETPSGILADRWSRKGVLMIASGALIASSIVCGASDNIPVYIIGTLLWGAFYALYSGTYDSILYDTLIEETGTSKGYETWLGRVHAVDAAALVTGALAGGALGQWFGLRPTFFWSVPFVLISILALWRFREPLLHKAEAAVPLKMHVTETFTSVLRKGNLLWVLGALVGATLIADMLYEFQQLWLIAIAPPAVLFGPAFALVIASSGIGGLLAGFATRHRRRAVGAALVIMLLSSVVLMLVPSFMPIVIAQTLLGVGTVMLSVFYMHNLHDALPSRVRAGASSAVSTLGRIFLIPASLVFGIVAERVSIFTAASIVLALVLAVGVCAARIRRAPAM